MEYETIDPAAAARQRAAFERGERSQGCGVALDAMTRRAADAEAHLTHLADIWTGLTPVRCTVIRSQSEELYNALGASATAVSNARGGA